MKLKFFELAKKISFLSDHPQHCHGAVIVQGNKLVSVGANKTKTHPRSTHPFGSTHAELSSILKADKDQLFGSTMYLYRERKDGSPANSRPCKFCQELLEQTGILEVYYSIEEYPFYKYERIA